VDVTFWKLSGRRYSMSIARERGPALATRNGPGYDDYLPHDAVHFLVEAEAGLARGVFGQIAAGRNNIFWPADPAQRRHQARREKKKKPTIIEYAEMTTSERLASLCQPLWELRAGRRTQLPAWLTLDTPPSPLVERILGRLDEFAARWRSLHPGGSITLTWPL
jgi:hypothetical protein